MNQLSEEPVRRRRPSAKTRARKALNAAVKAANSRKISSVFENTENMGEKVASVYGPYKNGQRWRVVYLVGGDRQSKTFDTREQAQAVMASLSASISNEAKMPIGVAVDEFLHAKLKAGLKPVSVRVWSDRLRLLPSDTSLAELTPSEAQALYDQWTTQSAVATHRGRLRFVRSLFAWAIERGYLTKNPFASVKPIGKPRRGKPQPRVDEARMLYAELLRHAQQGDDRAACLLVQMLHGARSSEVWSLRARDLDAGGTRLCIAADGGKTANATRTLAIEIPALRDILMQRRQNKAPDAYLFEFTFKRGGNVANAMLWKFLHRLCEKLGIPPVCPHALRGLHATLLMQEGMGSASIARVLGHGSDEVTKRHYIAPGAEQASNARSLAALLAPTEPSKPAPPAVSDLLATLLSLSADDRRALLAAVAESPNPMFFLLFPALS